MPDARSAREPRIAVIGAGPAGLAVAYYLRRLGYRDVLVLEKLGRVGGLCKSITDGYQSFDLGGTYITPSYRETLKIARSVGAERYRGKDYKAIRIADGGDVVKGEVIDWVRDGLGLEAQPLGHWQILKGCFRFWWRRRAVRGYVDAPTFAWVHEDPDLCVSFQDWLQQNDLLYMARMFQIAVTMMGYGFLHEVPAPYVLKYLAPGTFWTMMLRGIPYLRKLWAWPQRFELGFQRMWERLSWRLNVRLDVQVQRIRRTDAEGLAVEIDVRHLDRLYAHDRGFHAETLYFDRVIVACPLSLDVLGHFFQQGRYSEGEPDPPREALTLTDEEIDLFDRIKPFTYVQTTLHAMTEVDGVEKPFELLAPVVPVLPFTPETVGKPWIAVQVWEKATRLLQFYTRVDPDPATDPLTTRAQVEQGVDDLLARLGGRRCGSSYQRLCRWTTYDRWPYFGHVQPQDIQEGFFYRLENMQGANNTYYTGGAATFEMVEAVVNHARYVAERVDKDLQATFRPRRRVPEGPALQRELYDEGL